MKNPNAAIMEGAKALMALTRETAVQQISDAEAKSAEILAKGGPNCEKIKQRISDDVDRWIAASAEDAVRRALLDGSVDLSDCPDDYIPIYLAIIREGTDMEKASLQRSLSDAAYERIAAKVLDMIDSAQEKGEDALKVALAYSNADDKLADAMIAQAKSRRERATG